jgi:undecaprenyl phosphate-alpha-L-ara4N flippase subunit ArnF
VNPTRPPLYAIIAAVLSIVLAACGQLFMKAGMLEVGSLSALLSRTQPPPMSGVAWVIAGVFAYGTAIIAWLPLLARIPLSIAYPLVSLSYVLVYIGAVAWPRLGEEVSLGRSLGILLIVAGVALTSANGSRLQARPGGPTNADPPREPAR